MDYLEVSSTGGRRAAVQSLEISVAAKNLNSFHSIYLMNLLELLAFSSAKPEISHSQHGLQLNFHNHRCSCPFPTKAIYIKAKMKRQYCHNFSLFFGVAAS